MTPLFCPKVFADSFDDWPKRLAGKFNFVGSRSRSRGPHHPNCTFRDEFTNRAHRLHVHSAGSSWTRGALVRHDRNIGPTSVAILISMETSIFSSPRFFEPSLSSRDPILSSSSNPGRNLNFQPRKWISFLFEDTKVFLHRCVEGCQ